MFDNCGNFHFQEGSINIEEEPQRIVAELHALLDLGIPPSW